MHDFKKLKEEDPLLRHAEKQSEKEELSPMDPPDAYAPPNLENVDLEEFHPFLKELIAEHKAISEKLDDFEKLLLSFQENGVHKSANKELSDFFVFFDDVIVKHHRREERHLFPKLHDRLLETGEHSTGTDQLSSVDVMEDDHTRSLQLAAIVFNFFAAATRLPDPASRLILLDTAIEQGKALVELVRLHIFREDNVVFPQANRLLSEAFLDEIWKSPSA